MPKYMPTPMPLYMPVLLSVPVPMPTPMYMLMPIFMLMLMSMYMPVFAYAYVYLRRQQERDLMQKARLLTDENSVSFQMFLILLSSITLSVVQKAKFPCSKKVRAIFRSLFCFVCMCGGSMRRSQNLEIQFRFNFSRLSLALILKYYPILHAVKR